MLNHLLTGCPMAQGDGRYRWRLGKVLSEIAKWTDLQRVKANKDQAQPPRVISVQRESDKAALFAKVWHAASFPFEVSCSAFPAISIHYFLQRTGLDSKQLKKAAGSVAKHL